VEGNTDTIQLAKIEQEWNPVDYDKIKDSGDLFADLLAEWPTEWDGHPGHVRGLWGLGYKGELMVARVLEGTIVEKTAPTPFNGITRPTPKIMAGKRQPAIDVGARKKELGPR
jgi:hypothetical protein